RWVVIQQMTCLMRLGRAADVETIGKAALDAWSKDAQAVQSAFQLIPLLVEALQAQGKPSNEMAKRAAAMPAREVGPNHVRALYFAAWAVECERRATHASPVFTTSRPSAPDRAFEEPALAAARNLLIGDLRSADMALALITPGSSMRNREVLFASAA